MLKARINSNILTACIQPLLSYIKKNSSGNLHSPEKYIELGFYRSYITMRIHTKGYTHILRNISLYDDSWVEEKQIVCVRAASLVEMIQALPKNTYINITTEMFNLTFDTGVTTQLEDGTWWDGRLSRLLEGRLPQDPKLQNQPIYEQEISTVSVDNTALVKAIDTIDSAQGTWRTKMGVTSSVTLDTENILTLSTYDGDLSIPINASIIHAKNCYNLNNQCLCGKFYSVLLESETLRIVTRLLPKYERVIVQLITDNRETLEPSAVYFITTNTTICANTYMLGAYNANEI